MSGLDDWDTSHIRQDRPFYGVLIGVNTYLRASGRVGPLMCAANDVERAYEFFEAKLPRTKLYPLIDEKATLSNIQDALADIAADMEGGESLLIMFCGHGLAFNNNGCGDAALLTSDFEGDLATDHQPQGSFTMGDLRRWLKQRLLPGEGFKNIVVLLDACCSGSAAPNDVPYGQADWSRELCAAKWHGRLAVPRAVQIPEGVIGPRVDLGTSCESTDGKNYPWPAETVVIVSAAGSGQRAYELPLEGHGLFSKLMLDWLERTIIQEGGFSDFPNSALAAIHNQMASTKSENITWLDLQRPEAPLVSPRPVELRIDDLERPPDCAAFVSHLWPQDPPPDAQRYVACHIEGIMGKWHDIGAGCNLVLEGSQLLCRNAIAFGVAQRLEEREPGERRVYYVGGKTAEILLPSPPALSDWPDQHWSLSGVQIGPPLTGETSKDELRGLVCQLEEREAWVFYEYETGELDDLAKEFVGRCCSSDVIRFCLVTEHDPPGEIKNRIDWQHSYELPPLDHEITDKGVRDVLRDTSMPLPKYAKTPLMCRWLYLLDTKGEDVKALVNRAIPPSNRTPTESYKEVARAVLEKLAREEGRAKQLLELLKLMSMAPLPVCEDLVKAMAKKVDESLVGVGVLDRLGTLRDYALVEPKNIGDFYHVPMAVKEAIRTFKDRESKTDCAKYSPDSVAEAYRDYLSMEAGQRCTERQKDPWPVSVLAYQAIELFIQVNKYKDAASMLTKYWKQLQNDGHCHKLDDWADLLREHLDRGREGGPPLLLLKIMTSQQSLKRHLQRWDDVEPIANRIETLIGQQVNDPQPTEAYKAYLKSRKAVAHLNLLRGRFLEAIHVYQDIAAKIATILFNGRTKAQSSLAWRQQLCECLIRSAHCCVFMGDMTGADNFIKSADSLIEAIPEVEAPFPETSEEQDLQRTKVGLREHLLTVQVEKARLAENRRELRMYAKAAWESSLRSSSHDPEESLLRRAVPHVHMAWACLMDGQYSRSLHHALRARELFKRRRLPEYWWIGATEYVASLALAQAVWPDTGNGVPCFLGLPPPELRGSQKEAFSRLLKDQLDYANKISERCYSSANYPWRSAELCTAIGMMHVARAALCADEIDGQEMQAAYRALDHALNLAERECRHRLQQGYIREAMAILRQMVAGSAITVPGPESCCLWESSATIAVGHVLHFPSWRRCQGLAGELLNDLLEERAESSAKNVRKCWLAVLAASGWTGSVADADVITETGRTLALLREYAETKGLEEALAPPREFERLGIDPHRARRRKEGKCRYHHDRKVFLTPAPDSKAVPGILMELSPGGLSGLYPRESLGNLPKSETVELDEQRPSVGLCEKGGQRPETAALQKWYRRELRPEEPYYSFTEEGKYIAVHMQLAHTPSFLKEAFGSVLDSPRTNWFPAQNSRQS